MYSFVEEARKKFRRWWFKKKSEKEETNLQSFPTEEDKKFGFSTSFSTSTHKPLGSESGKELHLANAAHNETKNGLECNKNDIIGLKRNLSRDTKKHFKSWNSCDLNQHNAGTNNSSNVHLSPFRTPISNIFTDHHRSFGSESLHRHGNKHATRLGQSNQLQRHNSMLKLEGWVQHQKMKAAVGSRTQHSQHSQIIGLETNSTTSAPVVCSHTADSNGFDYYTTLQIMSKMNSIPRHGQHAATNHVTYPQIDEEAELENILREVNQLIEDIESLLGELKELQRKKRQLELTQKNLVLRSWKDVEKQNYDLIGMKITSKLLLVFQKLKESSNDSDEMKNKLMILKDDRLNKLNRSIDSQKLKFKLEWDLGKIQVGLENLENAYLELNSKLSKECAPTRQSSTANSGFLRTYSVRSMPRNHGKSGAAKLLFGSQRNVASSQSRESQWNRNLAWRRTLSGRISQSTSNIHSPATHFNTNVRVGIDLTMLKTSRKIIETPKKKEKQLGGKRGYSVRFNLQQTNPFDHYVTVDDIRRTSENIKINSLTEELQVNCNSSYQDVSSPKRCPLAKGCVNCQQCPLTKGCIKCESYEQ